MLCPGCALRAGAGNGYEGYLKYMLRAVYSTILCVGVYVFLCYCIPVSCAVVCAGRGVWAGAGEWAAVGHAAVGRHAGPPGTHPPCLASHHHHPHHRHGRLLPRHGQVDACQVNCVGVMMIMCVLVCECYLCVCGWVWLCVVGSS